jgi:hypothetical protein
MYPESFGKNLNYKLRELEIIIKQLDINKPALIDVDLALEKTRELYDLLLKLDTGHEPDRKKEYPDLYDKTVLPSDPELVQTENVFEAEEIIPDPKHKQTESLPEPVEFLQTEDEPESGKVPQTEDEPESGKVPRNEKAPDNVKLQSPDEEKPGKGEETSQDNETGSRKMKKNQRESIDIEIVADRYQSSQTYINQAMANKERKDISSRSRSKPLSDLRNSIGLNDKFLFIKELFSGKPDKYNQCIDALNRSGSYEEALEYIRNYCQWEEDNETAGKLLELVKRRHQSN